MRSHEDTSRPKLPPGAVKITIILAPKPDGSFVVLGKHTRIRPMLNRDRVEKCVYAIEHWSKAVARGMRIDSKVAPKVVEAFENVGSRALDMAAGKVFEHFFGKGGE